MRGGAFPGLPSPTQTLLYGMMKAPMQTPLNLELPDSGASADKAYIRKLLAEVERELHAEQKYAARLTMKWLVAYDMVRTQEASLMVQDGPILAEQTALRGYLAILRGHGIHLLAGPYKEWLKHERRKGMA